MNCKSTSDMIYQDYIGNVTDNDSGRVSEGEAYEIKWHIITRIITADEIRDRRFFERSV